MPRESKSDRLIRIHQEARQEFDDIQSAMRIERLQCLQDRRFGTIVGAQWEGDLAAQFANKPKFEVNKGQLAAVRITNEYRNNRITVDFVSKDGTPSDDFADACDGLYRADEQDSAAEEAYDNAFDEALYGGFGAWRLRTDYANDEDEDDDEQRVCIEPIFDADSSVFFDLNAKRQDKSDAKRAFVLTAYAKSVYLSEWKDDPATWPKDITQSIFDWNTPDVVYVAEYYRVEERRITQYEYESVTGDEEYLTSDDFTDDENADADLLARGFKRTEEKKKRVREVHKFIMSGGRILEDCGVIAGKCIPIVPMYGKRWFIDNVERCAGIIRYIKDVQRIKNMQISKLGELSAYSSVEKPIVTPQQIAGHQTMWEEDNIKNYPYLMLNPIDDPVTGGQMVSGPLGYTRPPQIPPAMAALLQITEQDMVDLLGNQQAGEEMISNISGKAVELIQNRLDMQSFIYMSNMAKAMKRSGEIWLSMMKDIAVEDGRKMKTVGTTGEVGSVELMRPMIDNKTGEMVKQYDFANARFDVAVEVGPSSSSKRAATVRALTGMMTITQDPETAKVLGAMAMMNMEGEGIGDARSYFRDQLVKMGVMKPTEEERAAMEQSAANQQPDPNLQLAEAMSNEANAKAQKAQAETGLTLAKIEQARADTAKVMADMDIDKQKQILAIIDQLAKVQQ